MNTCDTLLALAVVSLGAAAQTTELPDQLRSHFGSSGDRAMSLTLPIPNPTHEATGLVTFHNSDAGDRGVGVEWLLRVDGELLDDQVDFFSTSYKPTAVCGQAGKSNTLFVAGWIERSSTVVIEKWTFEDYAFAVAISPTGGVPIPSLTDMEVERRVVWECVEQQPLSSIACSPYSNQLWLLDEPVHATRSVRILPMGPATECSSAVPAVVTGTPIDVSAYPQLAGFNSLRAQKHPAIGFVILAEARRPWESGFDYQEPYQMLQLVDQDLDGVFDIVLTPTYTAFYTQYPLSGWEWDYTATP